MNINAFDRSYENNDTLDQCNLGRMDFCLGIITGYGVKYNRCLHILVTTIKVMTGACQMIHDGYANEYDRSEKCFNDYSEVLPCCSFDVSIFHLLYFTYWIIGSAAAQWISTDLINRSSEQTCLWFCQRIHNIISAWPNSLHLQTYHAWVLYF